MKIEIFNQNLSHQVAKILTFVFIFTGFLLLFLPIDTFAQTNTNIFLTKDQICNGKCPLIDGDFQFSRDGIINFILGLARFLTYIGTGLAVLFIVYGGFLIIIDLGGGKRAKAGFETIKSSIVGLVLIIVAYTIVAFISQVLTGSNFSLDSLFIT
jgi:hypothetical protein